MKDLSKTTLFNILRLSLAVATPVLAYALLTVESAAEFQRVGCVVTSEANRPAEVPFLSLALVVNILGHSSPVWAALLFANIRKRPKLSFWLMIFAILYCLGLVLLISAQPFTTHFSDNCNPDIARPHPQMFDWIKEVIVAAPVFAGLTGMLAGVAALIKKAASTCKI